MKQPLPPKVDICVVGAGSAGAALAGNAALRGIRVLCLDRRPLGGSGAHWVNGVGRGDFEAAGIDPPRGPELRGMDTTPNAPENEGLRGSLCGGRAGERQPSSVHPLADRGWCRREAEGSEGIGDVARAGKPHSLVGSALVFADLLDTLHVKEAVARADRSWRRGTRDVGASARASPPLVDPGRVRPAVRDDLRRRLTTPGVVGHGVADAVAVRRALSWIWRALGDEETVLEATRGRLDVGGRGFGGGIVGSAVRHRWWVLGDGGGRRLVGPFDRLGLRDLGFRRRTASHQQCKREESRPQHACKGIAVKARRTATRATIAGWCC